VSILGSDPFWPLLALLAREDAIGDEAAEHRQEIHKSQTAIAADPVRFVPISVQQFILRAFRRARGNHTAYVDYLSERYL
jgi:hypothetical protein